MTTLCSTQEKRQGSETSPSIPTLRATQHPYSRSAKPSVNCSAATLVLSRNSSSLRGASKQAGSAAAATPRYITGQTWAEPIRQRETSHKNSRLVCSFDRNISDCLPEFRPPANPKHSRIKMRQIFSPGRAWCRQDFRAKFLDAAPRRALRWMNHFHVPHSYCGTPIYRPLDQGLVDLHDKNGNDRGRYFRSDHTPPACTESTHRGNVKYINLFVIIDLYTSPVCSEIIAN